MAAATRWDQGDADRSVAPDAGPDASPGTGPGASAGAGPGASAGAGPGASAGAGPGASPDTAVQLEPLPPADDVLAVLALVVHRLFGIGLEVQSAAGVVDGPAADRLQLVVDELDELIREARSMAFERLRGPTGPGGPGHPG